MKVGSRQTVRPKWICEIEGERVEWSEDEWDQFAKSLKAGPEKRKAEERNDKEVQDEESPQVD